MSLGGAEIVIERYDELSLLTSARVDPFTGYHFYPPDQLPSARLIVWLRRLGMPLARIRFVCELAPSAVADEIATFWSEIESRAEARRALASFLVQYLSREVPDLAPSLTLRYAAHTDQGLVRAENLDVVFAGDGFAAVADGFGRTAASTLVSQCAIEASMSVPVRRVRYWTGCTRRRCMPLRTSAS